MAAATAARAPASTAAAPWFLTARAITPRSSSHFAYCLSSIVAAFAQSEHSANDVIEGELAAAPPRAEREMARVPEARVGGDRAIGARQLDPVDRLNGVSPLKTELRKDG